MIIENLLFYHGLCNNCECEYEHEGMRLFKKGITTEKDLFNISLSKWILGQFSNYILMASVLLLVIQ